jgi:DNA repair protein RecN (Recombination protein N)
MLLNLNIKNFALIDNLALEFHRGLNVLTGETGAGKSIILDAIDLVLGGKATTKMIRQGADKALIEANFAVNANLKQWLEEREIDLEDENILTCSRELVGTTSLRSRSRVNGVLVNKEFISELRGYLVEITAQGQTVELLAAEKQRGLLDCYGGDVLEQQRQIVNQFYLHYQAAKQALDKRREREQNRLQRLDLLQYQLQELDRANLNEPDELESLQQECDRLVHVVELQQQSYQAYQLLYQNDRDSSSAIDILGETQAILERMLVYDPQLEPILEMIREAASQVVEAGQRINAYGEDLEADPARLAEVQERMGLLKQIVRKYGLNLAEAIDYQQKLRTELEELTDTGQSLEELTKQLQIDRQNLDRECRKLTELREITAQKLDRQLVKELKPLAMDKVVFHCQISSIEPSASGSDRVEFFFSPNAGEKPQPLASIASGGEMSRFLLALKACFAKGEKASATLVFDEIDVGVSGKVAQSIAEKLKQLSREDQVLCVTHQPLVAAMADRHLRVDKQIIEEDCQSESQNGHSQVPNIRTVVRIKILEDLRARTQELAQLTGGNSAEEAVAFAESLIKKAKNYRNS